MYRLAKDGASSFELQTVLDCPVLSSVYQKLYGAPPSSEYVEMVVDVPDYESAYQQLLGDFVVVGEDLSRFTLVES